MKEKETRIKIYSGVSANPPSNNWAQEFNSKSEENFINHKLYSELCILTYLSIKVLYPYYHTQNILGAVNEPKTENFKWPSIRLKFSLFDPLSWYRLLMISIAAGLLSWKRLNLETFDDLSHKS